MTIGKKLYVSFGAVLAMVIFLAGSAALREYIAFIVVHNHAYGTLAAPIAALLFFFVLALGVLLGAEFNASLEQASPSRPRTRSTTRGWRPLAEGDTPEPTDGASGQDLPVGSDS